MKSLMRNTRTFKKRETDITPIRIYDTKGMLIDQYSSFYEFFVTLHNVRNYYDLFNIIMLQIRESECSVIRYRDVYI